MLQLRQIHVPPCKSTRKTICFSRPLVRQIQRCFPESSSAVSTVNASPSYPHSYISSSDGEETFYPDEDILEIRHLRDKLLPRQNPYISTNNWGGGFVGDRDKIRLHTVEFESSESAGAFCSDGMATVGDEDTCILLPEWAIRCGPRRTIYFDPKEVSAAVVTCGGLCPGLNDVVQNLVYQLLDYGVPTDNILGVRYGLRGFYEREYKPVQLTAESVDGIHLTGGTVLGTSRGGATIKDIVRRIDLWGLNMVFVVGGNGGNAAAHAIAEECEAQHVVCSIIGVPKSIDNDILLIDKCFGFETAVEEAQRALMAAKVEARSAHNGLGLVKLMGRQSGFIAMQASMAAGVVDVCLIPEVPFSLKALLKHVRRVLLRQGHCVVCVAEGAGQDILTKYSNDGGNNQTDASGNPVLVDVGLFLKDYFKTEFKGGADIKYIDPSYMIRSTPTASSDRVLCKVLGQNAVHAAFAGFTDATVGLVNSHYVLLPIPTITQAPRRVNPAGRRWNRLVAALGQPLLVDIEEPVVVDEEAEAGVEAAVEVVEVEAVREEQASI